MEVILLEKVENLGGIGDKVTVKSGYGRNFLLPQGKATLATPTKAHSASSVSTKSGCICMPTSM